MFEYIRRHNFEFDYKGQTGECIVKNNILKSIYIKRNFNGAFTCTLLVPIGSSSTDHQVVFFDFSLTVKAASHECVIRTGQP